MAHVLQTTIDLDAIAHNTAALKRHTSAKLMCVVKADAYNHGVERCVPVMDAHGADAFGVATFAEARRVRALTDKPVLAWLWSLGEDVPEGIEIGVPTRAHMQLLIDARELLRGYFHLESPLGFDAHAQEMRVEAVLPNGVPVRGFIDRVDVAPTGEVRVVDYKTGKMPKPQYSMTAKSQLRFYGLVYWRLTGVIPSQLKLMYLKPMDSMILFPSREELEYYERDLGDLWAKIEADGAAGSFRPKTSKLCGWCAFQSLCPVFGGTPPAYPGWPGSRADAVESE